MRPLLSGMTIAVMALGLAGCGGPPLGPIPTPSQAINDDALPLLRPYRGDEDLCQLTGEDAFTNQYLDDSADLVSCPTGSADAGTLITETGAVEVGQAQDYTLYSVPRG
ncbi:MAG: hypothetical protein AAGH83_00860 [Pseudomonadota bacterium]